jgi:cation:H+ antiporter
MLVYVLFVVGFVLLIKGADMLIDGSVSIAQRYSVSSLVIGLTVVAFGTSAPELAVNVMASFTGNNGLIIGNVVGSNIANVLLILGISAMIKTLGVKSNTVWREIPFSLISALVLGYMVNDILFFSGQADSVSRVDGLILMTGFAIFIFYTFKLSKKETEEEIVEIQHSVGKSVFLFVLGLIGLVLGGRWIVNGAVEIAQVFGLSESFIGFTIVAIGTSLPELATGVMAVRKGNTDIAIGNVIGSNIFNVFWVLGLSATINPISFNVQDNYSVMVNVIVTVVLFALLFIGKRQQLQRWQGVLLFIGYVFYLAALTWMAGA